MMGTTESGTAAAITVSGKAIGRSRTTVSRIVMLGLFVIFITTL